MTPNDLARLRQDYSAVQTMSAPVEKLQICPGLIHVARFIKASAFARQDLISANDHCVRTLGTYGNCLCGS